MWAPRKGKTMWKEIKLDGSGWARGRNGYFVPRRVELFKDVRGQVNLEVWSRRRGKIEPLLLRVSGTDAEKLADSILSLGKEAEK